MENFQITRKANDLKKVLEKLSSWNESRKSNITRAVLGYLPPNKDVYSKEFKTLYLSIAVMRTTQPENIKTDFIIFTPKESMGVPLSLGCVEELRFYMPKKYLKDFKHNFMFPVKPEDNNHKKVVVVKKY